MRDDRLIAETPPAIGVDPLVVQVWAWAAFRRCTWIELANIAGVCPATIKSMMFGKWSPSLSTLRKLSVALGVDIYIKSVGGTNENSHWRPLEAGQPGEGTQLSDSGSPPEGDAP